MEKFNKKWNLIPLPVRKPLVLVLGLVVIAAGIVMLVIPGPGWATIFLGFAILATEFKSAEKIKNWFIRIFKAIVAWLKAHAPKNKPKSH